MELEQQVQRLVDKDEIKELRAKYCYYWDERETEKFLSLFTEDAVFDLTGYGADYGDTRYHGHDEIEEFFVAADQDVGRFWVHMTHNPIIEIDGDEGTGQWYFEVPMTQANGDAGWVCGKYEEEYRRVDGEWKFQLVGLDPYYSADYQEGWADEIAND